MFKIRYVIRNIFSEKVYSTSGDFIKLEKDNFQNVKMFHEELSANMEILKILKENLPSYENVFTIQKIYI